ncbi:MAG: hypothetical protein QM451_02505 [Bacillota bacterium]|jgi:hypothetical protein|nr:hypothetical protein [Bacillota bacterium]HHT91154.1 hypothetical protein [Bacillota bacterium]
MGFLNNQLTQLNFQDHLLKTLKVICREDVQQPNNQITIDLEAAPAEPFTVTLTPLSFTSIVDQDKVFNTWTLEITITDADGNVEVIEETYQEDAVVCPFDLTQWPGQTIVQKHDVEFRIIGDPILENSDVIINFVINYCLVVAKEVLVKVNGAIQFC